MLILRIVLFVLVAILVAAIAPFLAIQQPIVFLVLVAVFIYLFSRRFATKKP